MIFFYPSNSQMRGYERQTTRRIEKGVMDMWIKGFIHTTPEEAFYGNVHIVKDIRCSAGIIVGYMELTDCEYVIVKKHPAGTYNGEIRREEVA